MNDRRRFTQLIEEVDFRLAHRRHLRERGVHLVVTHSHHVPGTLCAPGEVIEDIALVGQPEPESLGLSHMALLLMDCLCRYRLPLTALRIEQIMNTDPFYVHCAANRLGPNECIAKPDRRSVKVYVPRIRSQMEKAFERNGLNIHPEQILVTETTDSNIVVYSLRATVEIRHTTNNARTWKHPR